MLGKRDCSLLWVVVLALLLLPVSGLDAAEKDGRGWEVGERPLRLSVEYLEPTDESRDIQTVNVNAYVLITEIKKAGLSIYGGLTASYGDGDITQLEGDVNAGTLREVNLGSEAAGIGPGILVDLRLLRVSRFSLHADGSGSVIIYNREFPAGGDYYNFMWRGGPVLRYVAGSTLEIGLGYWWMHVSNGQGLGPQNPSYDARGPGLEISLSF